MSGVEKNKKKVLNQGETICVRAEDGAFWLILCFILYLYFFILFLFEAFQLFHRPLNEATNRITPVYIIYQFHTFPDLMGNARPRFFKYLFGSDAREVLTTIGCKPTRPDWQISPALRAQLGLLSVAAARALNSPNQVLTHAARAAAKQLFRRLWWPRAARAKGSGQSKGRAACTTT